MQPFLRPRPARPPALLKQKLGCKGSRCMLCRYANNGSKAPAGPRRRDVDACSTREATQTLSNHPPGESCPQPECGNAYLQKRLPRGGATAPWHAPPSSFGALARSEANSDPSHPSSQVAAWTRQAMPLSASPGVEPLHAPPPMRTRAACVRPRSPSSSGLYDGPGHAKATGPDRGLSP